MLGEKYEWQGRIRRTHDSVKVVGGKTLIETIDWMDALLGKDVRIIVQHGKDVSKHLEFRGNLQPHHYELGCRVAATVSLNAQMLDHHLHALTRDYKKMELDIHIVCTVR